MAKHILVTMQWEEIEPGRFIQKRDTGWVILKALAHNGQPASEIMPEPNGFTNELIVTDETLAAMEASPLCVVIWSKDA